MGFKGAFRGKPIFAERRGAGQIWAYDIVSPVEPVTGPGKDGMPWIDVGVDGTPDNPLLKVWREDKREWITVGDSESRGSGDGAAWGEITGTLSAQTDLKGALDGKAPTSHSHNLAGLTEKSHASLTGITATQHHSNANDPTADEKAALAGTNGVPSGSNKFVTDSDPRNADARTPTAHGHAQSEVANLVTDLAAKETPAGAQAKVNAHGAVTASVHSFDAAGNAPPQAHGLAGAAHSPDTLANLNQKVSDADVVALAGQLGGSAASPDVRGLRESGGQLLTMGAVADGQYLKRSGANVVGDTPAGGGSNPSYYGKIAGAYGQGDPADMLRHMQRAGNVAPTPTNVSTSIARCCFFRLPFNLTVNKIRFYGVGATTNVYLVAIYRYSDGARLTAQLAFTTAANAWGSAGASLNLALAAGTLYYIAVAVNATGTTAGVAAVGATIAAATGQIQAAPQNLPGNLDADAGFLSGYCFQFAVTSGTLPATVPTLVAQAVWTGGMPAFFLDNSNA